MALYTSQASGPWSTPSTWSPAGPAGGPGSGDTVIITGGYTVHVDSAAGASANGQVIIGTDSGAAITIQGTVDGTTLAIDSNCQLRCKGNLSFPGTGQHLWAMTLAAGAQFWLYPADNTTLSITNGNDGFYQIVCNGTSGNHCKFGTDQSRQTMKKAGNMANGTGYYEFGVSTATYTDFSDMGDSSNYGIVTNHGPVGAKAAHAMSITNCTFLRCSYMMAGNRTLTWDRNLTFQYNSFSNSVTNTNTGMTSAVQFATSSTWSGTYTRLIDSNSFDTGVAYNAATQFAFTNNVVNSAGLGVGFADPSNTSWSNASQFANNVICGNNDSLVVNIPASPMGSNYLLHTGANPHYIGCYNYGSGTPASTSITGVIFESSVADAGGDMIFPPGCTTGTPVLTVQNCIAMPNSGVLVSSLLSGASFTTKVVAEHNTVWMPTANAGNGNNGVIGLGENNTGGLKAGYVQSCRSNLCWAPTSGSYCFAIKDEDAVSQLTGTVTVSNGSTTLTGSGTSFQAQLGNGTSNMWIKIGTDPVPVLVASTSSNTAATLASPYTGSMTSGNNAWHISPRDIVTVAGYNGFWNPTSSTCYYNNGTSATVTGYTNLYFSTSTAFPNSNLQTGSDVTVTSDPFVDRTRNLATWGQITQGASGTYASAMAKLAANPALITQAGTGLLPWVKAGFAVRSKLFQGKSYAGDTSTVDAASNAWPGGSPGIGAMGWTSTSWYPGWTYRMPVTVDNTANTTSALSYFQVPVTISGAAYTTITGHANSDLSDLRVTDSDGTTLLSHVVEGKDTTNSVIYLLVKVPAVAAGNLKTVYVYYGNSSATSVSSWANTLQPANAATGPYDVFSQTDFPGYCTGVWPLVLKYQTGANASHNGDVLWFGSVGAQPGNQSDESYIAMGRSTDGGLTYPTKTTLVPHLSGTSYGVTGAIEATDGALYIIYHDGLNAVVAVGHEQFYVAKSTNAGVTWSNLTSRTNPVVVPWVYGTDAGAFFGPPNQDASGALTAQCYGQYPTGQTTTYNTWLMQCPAGSDPTNGSNWTVRGVMANGTTLGHQLGEAGVCNVSGNNWVSVMRSVVSPWDMYRSASTDNGATWSTPAQLGLLNATSTNSMWVSPVLLKLASGNIVLSVGSRQGTAKWGQVLSISTDGGATFLDRPACGILLYANAGNPWDYGNGGIQQRADGKILAMTNHVVGTNLVNSSMAIVDEDYILNCNNTYLDCEAAGTKLALGANAFASTTQKHSGTKSIYLDNTSATGGINPYADASIWPPGTDGNAAVNVAFSYWEYETQIGAAGNLLAVRDPTPTARISLADWSTPYHIEWYNGTAYQDTGVVTPLNAWVKRTVKAAMTPTSVSGRILQNNTDIGASVGQSGSGNAPQVVRFLACSTASTHNNTLYVDDVYSHQYTANMPVVTLLSEQQSASTVLPIGLFFARAY
jgi:hypothetical protein